MAATVSRVEAAPRVTSTEWRDRASCRDSDPDDFFPVGKGLTALEAEALYRCTWCPVMAECHQFAESARAVGIWAGKWRK